MAADKIGSIAEKLMASPSNENWEAFSKALKKSGIKYYKIIFANEGRLNKMQDLTKSVAQLYDSKYRAVARVPVFRKEGRKIRGATIYLKGLQVLNR